MEWKASDLFLRNSTTAVLTETQKSRLCNLVTLESRVSLYIIDCFVQRAQVYKTMRWEYLGTSGIYLVTLENGCREKSIHQYFCTVKKKKKELGEISRTALIHWTLQWITFTGLCGWQTQRPVNVTDAKACERHVVCHPYRSADGSHLHLLVSWKTLTVDFPRLKCIQCESPSFVVPEKKSIITKCSLSFCWILFCVVIRGFFIWLFCVKFAVFPVPVELLSGPHSRNLHFRLNPDMTQSSKVKQFCTSVHK